MKKYIRKGIAFVITLAILTSAFCNIALAAPRVIHQTVDRKPVTSGVILESYNRFTESGWISAKVLQIDLSNENVKVDSLISKESTVVTSKVWDLAKNSGAIAALNASFFDYGTGKKGYAYGPIMSSGKFDLAATRNNTDLATFSLDNLNNALFAYWDTKIELITPTGERRFVASYNRANGSFNGLQIVDSKWGKISTGMTANYPEWLEMIVVDGVVKEFSQNSPGVSIPENGFVIMAAGSHIKALLDTFKVGDPVSYEITLNVDASNMQMALTGGTMLVKDGQIVTSFTHSASGSSRQPRSALGTTPDGKTLIAVAVDGRSSKSIGMTQYELAEYMQELGCANAINLDGGGSTTMVAREFGTTGISTVNTPSDGIERGVTSALGVFSIAPQGPVDSLIVSAYEDYVFVNSFRAFTARGVDKYLNPANINPNNIQWSVEGVEGTFKSNVFYPTSAGKAVITATLDDNIIGTYTITVLSEPASLELNVDKLNTSPGQKTTFTLKGWSKDGYSASIPPDSVKWTVGGDVGTLSSGVFTAAEKGSGYVSAALGKTTVTCPVSIHATGLTKVIENFETPTLKLQTSSKSVTAKYEQATNVYRSKKYSAKLTYDFTKELDKNRVAYLNFPNGGHTLDANAEKLGIWVYSSAKKPIWIGATVRDASGKYSSQYFTKAIDWTGWKYLEIALDNVNNPKTITNVFAVQPTKQKASGTVYFDNLTMVYNGYPDIDMTKAPKTTVPVDASYKDVAVTGNDAMSFSVFGQSKAYSADVDKKPTAMLSTLSDRINKYLQASVLVGGSDGLIDSIKVPHLSTATKGYSSHDYNGNRLIQLDTSKGGLRQSNAEQWFWFKNQLDSFKGNNIFVFLQQAPASFNDAQEGALLKKTLSDYKAQSGKNVWVFYNGSTNTSNTYQGVKYISTAGFDSDGFSEKNPAAAKFCTVKVKGNTITYQFKSF